MNTFTVVIYKVISPVDEHKPSFHTTTQTKDRMKIAHKDREKSALQSMHQYLRSSTKFRPHPIDFLGSEHKCGLFEQRGCWSLQRPNILPSKYAGGMTSVTKVIWQPCCCWDSPNFAQKRHLKVTYLWCFSKAKIIITFWSPVKSTSFCIETITIHIIHWQEVIAMAQKLARLVRSITCQNTFPHRRLWKSFSACNRTLVTKCNQMSCNNVKVSSLEMKNDVFLSVTCNRGV